jgi:nucleoside-diphosphate-sugar epimerase
MGMRVVVTGNRGYIGSVLTASLLRSNKGHSVRGIDANFRPAAPGSWRFQLKETQKEICAIQAHDLTNTDAVIHLADVSANETAELALLARSQGVKRFIFASTCDIYAHNQGDSLCDETTIPAELTDHARIKLETEKMLAGLAKDSITVVSLRLPSVFGWSPNPRKDLPVNGIMYSALTSGEINLPSNGQEWQPFIHVQDAADAFILALETYRQLKDGIYNVGAPDSNHRIIEVAKAAEELTWAKIIPGGASAPSSYQVDFSRISGLGFSPKGTLYFGCSEIKKHFKEILAEKEMPFLVPQLAGQP